MSWSLLQSPKKISENQNYWLLTFSQVTRFEVKGGVKSLKTSLIMWNILRLELCLFVQWEAGVPLMWFGQIFWLPHGKTGVHIELEKLLWQVGLDFMKLKQVVSSKSWLLFWSQEQELRGNDDGEYDTVTPVHRESWIRLCVIMMLVCWNHIQ